MHMYKYIYLRVLMCVCSHEDGKMEVQQKKDERERRERDSRINKITNETKSADAVFSIGCERMMRERGVG